MKNEETNNSGVSKSGKRHVKPVDTDPHGEKLVQVVLCLRLCMWVGQFVKLHKFHLIFL